MGKYLKNIRSYSDLKETYKKLLKAMHPDNGGELEAMQELNCEYDALFKIWKDRAVKDQTIKEEEKTETASSTRRTFYTACGWEGSRYDSKLTLKEIAKIARNYVREKYPTTKWSIRTHYASMCQSLSVDLLEFPEKMYKTAEDLKADGLRDLKTYTDRNGEKCSYMEFTEEVNELLRDMRRHDVFGPKEAYTDDEWLAAYQNLLDSEKTSFICRIAVKTEYFKSVIDDVNAFIASYNYDDSDGMIDYFDVNFYDGKVDYSECKIVKKTARIAKPQTEPAPAPENTEKTSLKTPGKPFTVEESKHTKTGEKIYLVKWLNTLSKSEYISLNEQIKKIGGYYSKFTHSFIFKNDPENDLLNISI